nr:LAGLIDADG family homing endonuclease [Candidatus Njordarchaeota archaeon]
MVPVGLCTEARKDLEQERHGYDAKHPPNQSCDNKSFEQWYKLWKAHTVHPNLRINFFQTINTKEKAYWLGFLYADGYLVEHPNRAEIRLKLKIRDEDTINKFCDTLQLNKDKKESVVDEAGHRQAMIRFGCKKMSDDLIRHGLTFRKSKTIQFPNLPRGRLELAFLLGYYDGDGRRHTTVISSGSVRFLEQVKEKYKLPYKIYVDRRQKEIYGRKLKGTNYMMHLGPELLNKMMKNYKNSMKRKRWVPCERKERIRRAKEACTLEEVRKRTQLQHEWKTLAKENLEELVRQMPLKKIAGKYNVSQSPTVARKCRKYGIPIPERGYWTKVYWSRVKSLERNKKEKRRLARK